MEVFRKLATIQRIKEISPIEGADAIEVATINGCKGGDKASCNGKKGDKASCSGKDEKKSDKASCGGKDGCGAKGK